MRGQPFFIVGTGRCGTQMLRDILNQNKEIVIIPETHFIIPLFDEFGMKEVAFDDFYRVIDNMYSSRGYKWMEVILNSAKKNYDSFYRDFKQYAEKNVSTKNIRGYLETMYEFLYGRDKIFGDKTPHYGVELGIIKQIWPEAKIVHLMRDGVDTAASMMHHPGYIKYINADTKPKDLIRIMYKGGMSSLPDHPVSMARALRFWEKVILATLEEEKKIPRGDVLDVRYEDLLFHPGKEIRRIVGFLGLDSNASWVKRTMLVPRPFPESKQVHKFPQEKYDEYRARIREGMEAAGYPYEADIKRDSKGKIKELWRGRDYYWSKINPVKIIGNRVKKAFNLYAKKK